MSIPAVDELQVELYIEKHKERRYLEIYVHDDIHLFTLVTGWKKQKWISDSVRCSLLSRCKYITELTELNKH